MAHANLIVMVWILIFWLAIPTAIFSVIEYFLAKLESPWPGRVLPILSAVLSLAWPLFFLVNIAATGGPSVALLILWGALALIVLNIPTTIFLIVYRTTRKKLIQKKNVDKMNIQDL